MCEVYVMNRNGSLTIEAAFLIPFFLLMLSGTIELGIDLYQEAVIEAEEIRNEYWAVEDFYKYRAIEEVIGNDS